MKKILFVCTGNICRSPTAHAVARHKAKIHKKEKSFIFDSAGTDSYHAGESPDARSAKVGKERGISFDGIFARQITKQDFADFDLLLCMDRGHVARLRSRAPQEFHHKIKLFLEYCDAPNKWNDEVVDTYYGANKGFEEVFDVIDLAIEKLLQDIDF
jgi:protein-tyrosine phosphatase